VSPYRAAEARPLPATAPRASWWRRWLAEPALSNMLRARRARLLLRALAKGCPSDFARLMHGAPYRDHRWLDREPPGFAHQLNHIAATDPDGPPEAVLPLSAAQAIRALRGCSAEERDAVAKHVGGCSHCLALIAGEVEGPPGGGSGLVAMGPKRFEALAARIRDAWHRVP